jgi:hypothetical protein
MSNKKMEAMQRIKRGAVWEFGHRIFCKLWGSREDNWISGILIDIEHKIV